MQDEHFQRQWTELHDRSETGTDHRLGRLRAIIVAPVSERGPALRERAHRVTSAVLVGLAAGLTAGAALLATVALSASRDHHGTAQAAVRVYAKGAVLA